MEEGSVVCFPGLEKGLESTRGCPEKKAKP